MDDKRIEELLELYEAPIPKLCDRCNRPRNDHRHIQFEADLNNGEER